MALRYSETYLEYKFPFKDRIRILLGRKLRVNSFYSFSSPTTIVEYKPKISVFTFKQNQNEGTENTRRKM